MIVTFDTTILVRATARADGPARRAVEAIIRDHILALSPFILGEVGKVLSYPRMQALYRLTPDEIHRHLEHLRSVSRIIEPAVGIPVVLSDPHDDPIVYAAVAAEAHVLCAKDRHFFSRNVLAFCATHGIRVMDELTLLDLLSS